MGNKIVFVILALIIAVLAFSLWLMARHKEYLPTLVGAGQPVLSDDNHEILKKVSMAQLIEGLTRLERTPSVLFSRDQAERLVPVMPMLRQVLVEGGDDANATSSHLTPLTRDYVEHLLSNQQAKFIAELCQKGELELSSDAVTVRLPNLDKALHRRIGMYDDSLNSGQSPVRESLNQINLLNLMLGMLMLEQLPDYKVTPDQAKIMVSLLPVLKKVCSRDLSTIGSAYEPVVEAQIRSLLTDEQKLKVLELVQANVVGKLDYNEEALFKQIEEFLQARVNGGDLLTYANFLMAPQRKSLEGPAVIRGGSSDEVLALPLLMRGIMFQLEMNSKLRLDSEQVDSLELIAPAIQQCLNNVVKGVKDLRMPELQGRVASMLRDEQIDYIEAHKLDPMSQLDHPNFDGDPISKELERFLVARHFQIKYSPKFKSKKLSDSAYLDELSEENALVNKGSGVVGLTADAAATAKKSGAAASETVGGLGVVDAAAMEHELDLAKDDDSESNVHKDAVPGVKPAPTRNYSAPIPNKQTVKRHKNVAPPVGKRIKKTHKDDMPLEAVVRGMLISLEQRPQLRLDRGQLAVLARNLKAIQAALNAVENNPSSRNSQIQGITRALMNMLTDAQVKYIMANDGKSRIGLYPAPDGQSAWARELQRFVEAKSHGKPYQPLVNDVEDHK